MQQVFTQGPAKRTPLQSLIGKQVQDRVQGINPLLQQTFHAQNEATAVGANQARMDAMQPGMFGQGRATRGAQMAQNTALQQIAANKTQQSAATAKDIQDAATQGQGWQRDLTAEDVANRNFAYNAAKDLNDSVGMAGLQTSALDQMGTGYTGYGEEAMAKQATQQAADAEREKRMAFEEWQTTQAARKKAAGSGKPTGILAALGGVHNPFSD